MTREFYQNLYSELLATCPVDTRNMVTHIALEDYGDYWRILITAPRIDKKNAYYDYAKAVNYNRQRSAKEKRNFKWVERIIKRVAKINKMGVHIKDEL